MDALVGNGHCGPDAPLDYGDTFAQTTSFLCRDEDEVRQKANKIRNNGRGSSDEGILAPVRIVIDSAYAP